MSAFVVLPFACVLGAAIYFVATTTAGLVASRFILDSRERLGLDEIIKLRAMELVPLVLIYLVAPLAQLPAWSFTWLVFLVDPLLVQVVFGKNVRLTQAIGLSVVMCVATLGISVPATGWIFREFVHFPIIKGWC